MPACIQDNRVQTVPCRGVWHCLCQSPSHHRRAMLLLCWWSWRVDEFLWCSVYLLGFLTENFTLLEAGGGIVSCKGVLGISTQMKFPCPKMCLDSQPVFLISESFGPTFIILITLRLVFLKTFQH